MGRTVATSKFVRKNDEEIWAVLTAAIVRVLEGLHWFRGIKPTGFTNTNSEFEVTDDYGLWKIPAQYVANLSIPCPTLVTPNICLRGKSKSSQGGRFAV
jgi:hypothetical protein